MIKARVAGGQILNPSRELLNFVEPLIYKTTIDFRTGWKRSLGKHAPVSTKNYIWKSNVTANPPART